MEKSQTIASGKTKYARLFMMGNPTQSTSLEGHECATVLSFQTESYASGTKALSTAYEIDSKSHQAMISMGFRRTYGPEEVANSRKEFQTNHKPVQQNLYWAIIGSVTASIFLYQKERRVSYE